MLNSYQITTRILLAPAPAIVLMALTACGASSGLQTGLTEPGADADTELVDNGDSDDQGGSNSNDSDWGMDCTYDAFPVQMNQATQNNGDPSRPLFVYQGRNNASAPFDEIQIASYQGEPYNGPRSPGTYSLDGNNYEDCALCMLLIMDCDEQYACNTVFFADEGDLEVTSMSANGGRFTALLNKVVFREVTIDSSTYESKPISGGKTWCLNGLSVDVDTQVL
jgi:hypothetical protein